jgi:hypothetical protein
MEIIDSFLSKDEFEGVHSHLMGYHFPWYYNPIVDYDNHLFDIFDLDSYQFVHDFSLSDKVLNPITEKLKIKKVIRIKANLNPRTSEVITRKFHVDTNEKCKTAILYLNTSDGYTEFEDGSRVDSRANRMVIFDSQTMHRGTTCTNQKTRVVINFNYET